jgi:hypothetical protein
MDYLPQLTKLAGTPSKDNRGFTSLIDSNRVERILRANGYATIRINAPPEMFHRDFSGMLLRTTLLATADFSRSRERTLDVLRRLYQARPTGAPTFVYCHIMCPHDPYVFGPHGEPKSLLEQNQAMSSLPARRRAYVDQVQFMNSRVDSLLDLIMARKDRRSIVILQADHGPRNEAPMDKPTARSLREGAGILNAYYLPDGGSRGLYDSISPVNSFRLVLRNYLGFDYELLPDRSYHNVPKHQYQVIPVPLVSSVAGTALAAP